MFSRQINFVIYFISLSIVVIFVKNIKYTSSVITMNLLLNFYNLIQISNFSLLSFSCWLRGKSSLPLLNDKVKLVNSCVKIYDYLKLWITSKVVGSMQFFLPKYLWNNWHAVALIGVRIKLPKNIDFVLFECIYFIKEPIQMKGF